MPSANAGNEIPDTASVMPRRSGHRLRNTAEKMPMVMPNSTDQAMLTSVNSSVGMKRSAISVDTGRRVRIDVPRSPWTILVKKRTHCSGSGLSSPSSARTSSTVSRSASCPAARRAGSPGSMCTNRNTSTATINSVGTSPTSRMRKSFSIFQPGRRCAGRGAPRASSVLQPGGRLLGKRDFAGVDVAVGHHVHTVELLAAGVQRALGDQRGPRRVFPDLLLRLFVQLRLFLVIDRTQGLGDIGVHYIVLVVGGVVQPGRKRFGCQQRTQRPVGLAGGSGPAGVVHAHGRLGRFGRLLHPFRALPHFQGLHLHLAAYLA